MRHWAPGDITLCHDGRYAKALAKFFVFLRNRQAAGKVRGTCVVGANPYLGVRVSKIDANNVLLHEIAPVSQDA
jgi:hypothetical protein